MRQVKRAGAVWGVIVLAGLALSAAGRAAWAGCLVDQGWSIVEEGGARAIEMRVSVVNEEATAQSYQVRFLLEAADKGLVTKVRKDAAAGPPVEWSLVSVETVEPVSVEANSSALVTKRMPYERMGDPQKAYRFEVELLLLPARRVIGTVMLASHGTPFLESAVAGVGGVATAAMLGGGEGGVSGAGGVFGSFIGGTPGFAVGGGGPKFPSGEGLMQGTHTAHRAGGQWVEHGSGTITLKCTGTGGVMVLSYTYDSSGPSAMTLVASAQGTGTYRLGSNRYAVTVPSASARMTYAGARTQAGTVITRTGASATGTFTGTLGSKTYSGIVTLAKGTQTLDLATGQGTHSFTISFVTR